MTKSIYAPRCESSLDEVKTWLIKVLYDFSELSVSLLHSSLIAVKSNLHDTSLATFHRQIQATPSGNPYLDG